MLCGNSRSTCDAENVKGLNGIINVDSFVYLGVNVDKNLNFEKFLSATIQKVNGRLVTLARIHKLVDVRTCLLIYKQTILPILDYAQFWLIPVEHAYDRKITTLANS